jgi:thiamine-monophosphate kinase
MIDVSDGLAADAGHLGRASGTQLRIELARVPLAAGVAEVAAALEVDPGELAAAGGEDYELCFTLPAARAAQAEQALAGCGMQLTWVGEVAAGPPGAALLGRGGDVVGAEGFEHRW